LTWTIRVIAGVLLLACAFAAGWIVGRTGIGAAVDPASLSDRERAFTERMKNVSLVGVFTVAGRDTRTPSPDRYDIRSVDKVGDDLWRFTVSMSDSGNAVVPVTVPMRWVGDTPVIDMREYSIPGMGSFSAHVVFDGDQYAGTWANPKVGGLMYGRIEKMIQN
jgi:hypothetical protein